jgi:hypothetical protein
VQDAPGLTELVNKKVASAVDVATSHMTVELLEIEFMRPVGSGASVEGKLYKCWLWPGVSAVMKPTETGADALQRKATFSMTTVLFDGVVTLDVVHEDAGTVDTLQTSSCV